MPPPKAVIALIAFLLLQHAASKSLSAQEQAQYKHLIEGKGLYAAGDGVEVLTADNFKRIVFNRNTAWIVEFYNSWCGFCQRFVPTWRALAADTKPWRRMVNVGAIDCADDANSPLCRDFEIMSYPTLRYFHEYYHTGIGKEAKKGKDLEQQKQYLLEEMTKDQQKGRGEQFPNLQSYNHPDLSSLQQEVGKNARNLFLFVDDDENGIIGAELELDFASIPSIGIRFTNAKNKALIDALGLQRLPILLALDSKRKMHLFPDTLRTRSEFRQAIVDYLRPSLDIHFENDPDVFRGKWVDSQVPDINMLLQAREKHAIREKVKQARDAVYQVDLETALKRSLKNDVGSKGEISGEQLQALRDYVNVLRAYFPIRRDGERFLLALYQLVHATNVVHGKEIVQLVTEHESRMVFTSPHEWMACEGSSVGKRGFPCGMWKLFHYLTVQASPEQPPRQVLNAMHGYVQHFFGCADCAQHFQEMARATNMHKIETVDEAIMWLWRAHNQVNERIKGDETEDPEYPKVQFPSADNCAQCRFADGTFNAREVLPYLKNMYSRARIQYLGSDESLFPHVDDAQTAPNKQQRRSIWQRLDTSMCFIIYFISFALILILIRLFFKRGYRKKMYAHDLLGKV